MHLSGVRLFVPSSYRTPLLWAWLAEDIDQLLQQWQPGGQMWVVSIHSSW